LGAAGSVLIGNFSTMPFEYRVKWLGRRRWWWFFY